MLAAAPRLRLLGCNVSAGRVTKVAVWVPGCCPNHSLQLLGLTVWFDPSSCENSGPGSPDYVLIIQWLLFLGFLAPYIPQFFGYVHQRQFRIIASWARWCGRSRVKAARFPRHCLDRNLGRKRVQSRTEKSFLCPATRHKPCPVSDFSPEYASWLASDDLRGGYKRARKSRRSPNQFSAGGLAKT